MDRWPYSQYLQRRCRCDLGWNYVQDLLSDTNILVCRQSLQQNSDVGAAKQQQINMHIMHTFRLIQVQAKRASSIVNVSTPKQYSASVGFIYTALHQAHISQRIQTEKLISNQQDTAE